MTMCLWIPTLFMNKTHEQHHQIVLEWIIELYKIVSLELSFTIFIAYSFKRLTKYILCYNTNTTNYTTNIYIWYLELNVSVLILSEFCYDFDLNIMQMFNAISSIHAIFNQEIVKIAHVVKQLVLLHQIYNKFYKWKYICCFFTLIYRGRWAICFNPI